MKDRTGDQKGVEWEPQIRSENRRRKSPDTNTTPLLLKCANTTQHGQAASVRNTIRVSQNFYGSKTREHTQSQSGSRRKVIYLSKATNNYQAKANQHKSIKHADFHETLVS